MRKATGPILLTGGAGFIGSHLAEALMRSGNADLAIVDDLNGFYSPDQKRENLAAIRQAGAFTFFCCDIQNAPALRDIFDRVRPQKLIHLAACAGVRPSIEKPLLYEHVNVAGTLTLLELCREFGVQSFIFGSSSSVYGASSKVPFSEDQVELRPISPYAATKICGELLGYTYSHLHEISVIALRFFTVYGPRQRPDLAIYKFTDLIEQGKPIPIFGDGNAGRDYTYVGDIVAGILAALQYEVPRLNGARFEAFNLGNSYPVTLNCLVDMLEQATGKPVIRQPMPPQPGDVPITWADISKASRLLGYAPRTTLEQGLREFVQWFRAERSRPVFAEAQARQTAV
jgi:UDP-glucuronate 4-epimerase